MIAVTQVRQKHSEGRAYFDKKLAEGKTRKEALRCLKRHLARRFYRLLAEPVPQANRRPTNTLPNIACLT